jgi:hypothetical protein
MNKKLMILPISLLSCLIGGCHHPATHLSFSDILNEKANHAYIKTNDVNEYDYGFKIRDIIKDYSDSVKKQTFFKDGNENNLWMEFDIDPYNVNDFDALKIYFYNDGRVNTVCSGASMLSGAYTQKTSYIMDEKQLDSLKQEVNARIEEVDRIEKEEEAKAKEYATTERFFELLDNPPEVQKRYMHVYLNGSSNFRVISNFTPELKQDLVNLDFKEIETVDYSNVFSDIDIRVTDDWVMMIYRDIPIASFYYAYHNTLTYTHLDITFSINEEMKEVLMNRCKEMINNGTSLHN